jgi:hypothetical protein
VRARRPFEGGAAKLPRDVLLCGSLLSHGNRFIRDVVEKHPAPTDTALSWTSGVCEMRKLVLIASTRKGPPLGHHRYQTHFY